LILIASLLEETTETSLCNMVKDYSSGPKIQGPLPEWSDRYGLESSTLKIDVWVCRYAPLVVHAAEEEWVSSFLTAQQHYKIHSVPFTIVAA